LLCPRRHGESHQGTVLPVQRPAQHGDHARQSIPAVSLFASLCTAAGSASFGVKGDRTGARASFHAAPQITQDRSPDSGHGAPSLGSDGHQLCPPTLVRNRLPTTTLLTSEQDQLGPAVHKTGKQTSSQRQLCQKLVSAPPRRALAAVSSRAPSRSSPRRASRLPFSLPSSYW